MNVARKQARTRNTLATRERVNVARTRNTRTFIRKYDAEEQSDG